MTSQHQPPTENLLISNLLNNPFILSLCVSVPKLEVTCLAACRDLLCSHDITLVTPRSCVQYRNLDGYTVHTIISTLNASFASPLAQHFKQLEVYDQCCSIDRARFVNSLLLLACRPHEATHFCLPEIEFDKQICAIRAHEEEAIDKGAMETVLATRNSLKEMHGESPVFNEMHAVITAREIENDAAVVPEAATNSTDVPELPKESLSQTENIVLDLTEGDSDDDDTYRPHQSRKSRGRPCSVCISHVQAGQKEFMQSTIDRHIASSAHSNSLVDAATQNSKAKIFCDGESPCHYFTYSSTPPTTFKNGNGRTFEIKVGDSVKVCDTCCSCGGAILVDYRHKIYRRKRSSVTDSAPHLYTVSKLVRRSTIELPIAKSAPSVQKAPKRVRIVCSKPSAEAEAALEAAKAELPELISWAFGTTDVTTTK